MEAANSYRYLRCDSCGQVNRVLEVKFNEDSTPKCGKCKAKLSLHPHPASVTDQNFQAFISSPVPVLIDFWAPWCGPCHALAPTIEQIARDYAGQILVAKLNTDENSATAARFQVRGIPTVILFNNGSEVDRLVGVQPRSEIDRHIQALIGV